MDGFLKRIVELKSIFEEDIENSLSNYETLLKDVKSYAKYYCGRTWKLMRIPIKK